ncbi:MAG: Gfo/Idh/MocA family protein [Candidatus Hermodarchaeota archaeon]
MKDLNVGIIGYGYIAKIHMGVMKRFPNIKISSVFSRTKKKIRGFKNVPFYTDIKQMLNNEQLDTVFITTPTHTHKEIACECAERGLNIFLEKPMARFVEECDSIIKSVEENNVKLFVAQSLRFWLTYGSVRNYVMSKASKIGKVQFISSKRLGSFPWSEWFADQHKSGGVILDLSIHDIDFILWILGKPESVSCKAKVINRYKKDLFGESLTTLNYNDNIAGECEASWAKPTDFIFYTHTLVKGEKGAINFDGGKIYDKDKLGINTIYNSENGYINQMEHFIDAMSNNKKNFIVSPYEAKEDVKVCLAAIKSAKNGGEVVYLDDFE